MTVSGEVSAHPITEYGTTRCPNNAGIAAEIDKVTRQCSACGAVCPAGEVSSEQQTGAERVKDHALRNEGRPFLIGLCCGDASLTEPRLNTYDRIGHGVCECGATSSCQDANDYRKQWHREHKAALTAKGSSDGV